MAYLGKYIRQILSRQEPVIFPGFGSLIFSESKGAKGADGKIEPPGAIIRFDADHPKEDGRLAEEYASGEHVDQEEARQQVLELVDAIKFKLDKGEKYSIELVGTFSRDHDNRIHFLKDPNWVVDPELFGLNSLDLLELENETDEAKEEEQGVETVSATDTFSEPVVKETFISPVRPAATVVRRPVNKWKIIWIVVGALLIVLLAILLIPSGNGVEFGKDGIVLKENDTVKKQENKVTQPELSGPEETKEEQAEVKEQAEMPPVNTNNYFTIAGSFQSLPNATELMENLKASGFPSEIIITENRMYRVSVQSYATREEALKDLTRIKSKTGLSSAWVMTR